LVRGYKVHLEVTSSVGHFISTTEHRSIHLERQLNCTSVKWRPVYPKLR